jgi:hypothetical protein
LADADLAGDVADLVGRTTVDALSALDDVRAHRLADEIVPGLLALPW